jgi:hypothetical protein
MVSQGRLKRAESAPDHVPSAAVSRQAQHHSSINAHSAANQVAGQKEREQCREEHLSRPDIAVTLAEQRAKPRQRLPKTVGGASLSPILHEGVELSTYADLADQSEEYRKQTEALIRHLEESQAEHCEVWRSNLDAQAKGLAPGSSKRSTTSPFSRVSLTQLYDGIVTMVKEYPGEVDDSFKASLASFDLQVCLEIKRALSALPKTIASLAGKKLYFKPHWIFEVEKRLEVPCDKVKAVVSQHVERHFKVSQGLVKRKSEAVDALRPPMRRTTSLPSDDEVQYQQQTAHAQSQRHPATSPSEPPTVRSLSDPLTSAAPPGMLGQSASHETAPVLSALLGAVAKATEALQATAEKLSTLVRTTAESPHNDGKDAVPVAVALNGNHADHLADEVLAGFLSRAGAPDAAIQAFAMHVRIVRRFRRPLFLARLSRSFSFHSLARAPAGTYRTWTMIHSSVMRRRMTLPRLFRKLVHGSGKKSQATLTSVMRSIGRRRYSALP